MGDNIYDKFQGLSDEKRKLLIKMLMKKQNDNDDSIIKARPKSEKKVMSFAQERLWFLNKLDPNSPVYNMAGACHMKGNINIDALRYSLNTIIKRHEILRTTYSEVEGKPEIVLNEDCDCNFRIINIGELPDFQRDEKIKDILEEEVTTTFNLEKGPVLRFLLIQINKEEYIGNLTMHHIVSDGFSTKVFFSELINIYETVVKGLPLNIQELPIQYSDYAYHQKATIDKDLFKNQMNYWKTQLAGEIPVLELPTDRIRPAMKTGKGARVLVEINSILTKKLKDFNKNNGVTNFMTLMSVLNILFYSYSGQEEFAIGSPISGRNNIQVEKLIGCFINMLIFRVDMSGNPTFMDILSRTRKNALDAYSNQDVPFEKIVEEMQPDRNATQMPFFQVVFGLEKGDVKQMKMSDLILDFEEFETNSSKYDITFELVEEEDILTGWFEYNTDLFNEDTIKRFANSYIKILETVLENPNELISNIDIISYEEKNLIINKFNDTKTLYPRDKSLIEVFEEQVKKTPDKIAVVFNEEEITYKNLNLRVNSLASLLREKGVKNNDLIGIISDKSIEMIIGTLAILKAGGAYLPIDYRYPADRVMHMINDSKIKIILSDRELSEEVTFNGDFINLKDKYIYKNGIEGFKNISSAKDLAYVIYTSGSTGKPKGVMVTQRSIMRLVKNTNYIEFKPEDRILQTGSIVFDASTFEIWGALLNGLTLYLVENEVILNIQSLEKAIKEYKITTMWLTSPLFNQLSQSNPKMFMGIRNLLVGGDALSPNHINRVRDCCPGITIVNGYGPTENTTFSVCNRIAQNYENNIPIGKPISNSTAYIVNRSGKLKPIGVPGELWVGGDGVALGYLNRKELTEEKFIDNVFNGEGKIYKTGDLARWLPNGDIEFIGRMDQQVKIRGFRIELGEIENQILKNRKIKESIVIDRQDNQGKKYLCAYIVSDSEIKLSDIRKSLSKELPDYMIPSSFVFVDNALPKTINGKVDKKALLELECERPKLEEDYMAPTNEAEKILTDIWSEVLGIDNIGIKDNFFELGGDSILSIQIIAKANQAGLSLLPKHIFENQTIEELAKVGSDRRPISAEQGIITGSVPLSPIQNWFFEEQYSQANHFNMSVMFEVKQKIDSDILEKAVCEVVNHHDALRMSYKNGENGWEQNNDTTIKEISLYRFDLSEYNEEKSLEIIKEEEKKLQASFDLGNSPMIRLCIFDNGTDKNSNLLVIVHHLVIDAVSWSILMEDIQTAYQQLESGKDVKLPKKTTSFKQWSERLIEYSKNQEINSESDYWISELENSASKVPFDFENSIDDNIVSSERKFEIELSEEMTQDLLRKVPSVYNTQIVDILLTALMQTLKDWSGFENQLIEIEGHGREELFEDVDLNRTIGWFTNIHPVALVGENSDDLGAAIKDIKEKLRGIPNNGIGFGINCYLGNNKEKLKKLLKEHSPEILFNYMGQIYNSANDSSIFRVIDDFNGNTRGDLNKRSYVFELNSMISNNKLKLIWGYSENLHSAETIENLCRSFISNLEKLILHCLSPEAGGFTFSDFSDLNWDKDEFDDIAKVISESLGGATNE